MAFISPSFLPPLISSLCFSLSPGFYEPTKETTRPEAAAFARSSLGQLLLSAFSSFLRKVASSSSLLLLLILVSSEIRGN